MTSRNKVEFDIVIPVHKKDLAILEYCVKAAREKIVGVRKIIVVSKERYTKNAEWFDEAKFPFSFQDIAKKFSAGDVGWHYQQLLKMYAPLVIPGICENVMILDSDTVFFKKTKMFDKQNRPYYSLSKDTKVCRNPFDLNVEAHITRVWPAIAKRETPKEFHEFSGISHNMIFNRKVMEDLFQRIEEYHGNKKKFHEIFLDLADKKEHSVSEYQIYFNFITIFYRDKIAIRRLKYKNTADINIRKYRKRFKYHYCSFHSYLRQKRGSCYKVKLEKILCGLYKKLFQVEQWNIGIAKCNISEFLTIPNQEINWLKAPKINEFRADPFGIQIKNKNQILFERYDFCKRKGEICAIEIDDNFKITSQQKVLEKDNHLSYPYTFQEEGKNYCIIESHREKNVTLYEISDNLELKKVKTIFENLEIVDPSIIKHDNKFWMFFTLNSNDDQLHIAYSQKLDGEWKMHKNNPVKNDSSSSRSAGKIFEKDGSLYRPAQNCTNIYGASININKITKLTEDEFEEIHDIEITPNQLSKYPNGLHSISPLGENLTLIDGKRKKFTLFKIFLSFCRLWRKIFG